MKVVLFCGGQGMRIRDYSHDIPKPMVPIGYRPIMWHVMKYYAAHGHKDFILCLGYKADVIKDYFLNYRETLSNDFVITDGGARVEMLGTDTHDWRITFVDTGYWSQIGERLKAVEKYLEGEEMFLANYSDILTDFHLPTLVDQVKASDKIAGVLCVKPRATVHLVDINGSDEIQDFRDFRSTDLWVNGGYFVFRHQIFDELREKEDLVGGLFDRLIEQKNIIGHRYDGFWVAMETFKDQRELEDLHERDQAPWKIWKDVPPSSIAEK